MPSSPLGKLKSDGILNGPLRTISKQSASKTCGRQRAGSVGGGTQVSTLSPADGLSMTGLVLSEHHLNFFFEQLNISLVLPVL